MILEATLPAERLRNFVEGFKDLVGKGNVEAGPTGMALMVMDEAHVSLVRAELTEFESYACQKPIVLGINFATLAKVLRTADRGDYATLTAHDESRCVVTIGSGGRVGEYELSLLDIDQESLNVPDTEAGATLSMPSAEYARTCTTLAGGDVVELSLRASGAEFASKNDAFNARVTHAHGEACDVTLRDETLRPAAYSLKHLALFAKAVPLCDSVELHLTAEAPLRVAFPFRGGRLEFFLAPKISDEEDF